ncbi:MAG: HD domain-containing protein [Chloroflexi bacterium]|nr:HD domain-containing protein [Chloroflexota bacterium]
MTRLARARPFIPPPKAIAAVKHRLAELPEGLRAHIERTRAVGLSIAFNLGVDAAKADFALAAHDLFRAAPSEALLDDARRLGWDPDDYEAAEPLLLHGPVAGLWLEKEVRFEERSVVSAITYHTTYAPGLGDLAAAVFLADKVEPGKLYRGDWLIEVRDLAFASRASDAIILYLTKLSEKLRSEGSTPHPRTAEAVAWLRDRASMKSPPPP